MPELQTIVKKVDDEQADLVRSYMQQGNYEEAQKAMEQAGKEPEMVKPEANFNDEKTTYLLLYEGYDNEDGTEYKTFEEITGKLELYNRLKNLIPEGMDIHASYIVNTAMQATLEEFKENASVYEFMRYQGEMYQDDTFDIEDYN